MPAPRFVLPVPPPDATWRRLFVDYLIDRRPSISAPVAEQSAAAAFEAMFLLTPYEAVDWWDQAMSQRLNTWGRAAPGGE
jgi:hypothetical protein